MRLMCQVCLALGAFDFLKVTIFFVNRFKNDNKSFISRLSGCRPLSRYVYFILIYIEVFKGVNRLCIYHYMKKGTSIF